MGCPLLVQVIPVKVLPLTSGWQEPEANFTSFPEWIRILNVQGKCWTSATAITGRKKKKKKNNAIVIAHFSLKKLWCQETKYPSATSSSLGVARRRSFLPHRPPQSWDMENKRLSTWLFCESSGFSKWQFTVTCLFFFSSQQVLQK